MIRVLDDFSSSAFAALDSIDFGSKIVHKVNTAVLLGNLNTC